MKTLRVRIDRVLWEDLQPHIKHGDISRILRRALREFVYGNAKRAQVGRRRGSEEA